MLSSVNTLVIIYIINWRKGIVTSFYSLQLLIPFPLLNNPNGFYVFCLRDVA